MTLSMLQVKDLISDELITNLDPDTLGFILCVIRDNCLNYETYKILNRLIDILFEYR